MIGHGWGPGWGIIGFLLMAAFWTLVIILIVGLVRGRPTGWGAGAGAVRILEERYARGEMSRDEFLERRAVLSGQRPEPGAPTEPTPPPKRPRKKS